MGSGCRVSFAHRHELLCVQAAAVLAEMVSAHKLIYIPLCRKRAVWHQQQWGQHVWWFWRWPDTSACSSREAWCQAQSLQVSFCQAP